MQFDEFTERWKQFTAQLVKFEGARKSTEALTSLVMLADELVGAEPINMPRDTAFAALSHAKAVLWGLLATFTAHELTVRYFEPNMLLPTAPSFFMLGDVVASVIFWLGHVQVLALREFGSPLLDSTGAEFPVCAEKQLFVANDAPLMHLRQSALLGVLARLRNLFTSEPFSVELFRLCDMLELCAAEMVYSSGTDVVFDMPEHRVPLSDGYTNYGLFGANLAFMAVCWATFLGVRRRDMHTRGVFKVNIDRAELAERGWLYTNEELAPLRTMLHRIVLAEPVIQPSVTLRACNVAMNARPGDVELFHMTKPSTTLSANSIVSASVGDTRMSVINVESRYTPTTGTAPWLAATDGQPEPAHFGYCMQDVLKMKTADSPGGIWPLHYSRTELDVRNSPSEVVFRARQHPILCQLFNCWQLAFAERALWFDSTLQSLAMWLRLLRFDECNPSREFEACRQTMLFRALMATLPAETRSFEEFFQLGQQQQRDE